MSKRLRIRKVISSLPSPLQADTIYLVRVGTGFDLYVSDTTGQYAHTLNPPIINPIWHVLNNVNTNTWYIPYAIGQTALTTLALTASRIYLIPFVAQARVNLTQLAIEVTTSSAGTAAVGIYDTNVATFRPNNLLGSISGLDTGSTGVKSGSLSPVITLEFGRLYWLALVASAAATIRAVAVGSLLTTMGIATGGTAWNSHYYASGSSLTNPAPTSLTNATGTVPAIYVRYSYV